MQKNQVVEIDIEDLAYGGLGLGRIDGYVVFVAGALPGDRVRARIERRQPGHARARVEAILKPSALRIDAPCPLHDFCGGCVWQTLPDDEQRRVKQRHVAESLKHIGRLEDLPFEPIAGSPLQWRYRNKMDFTFGRDGEGRTILGFHYPGRFDRTFDVPACLIQPEAFDAALGAVRDWARAAALPPYDPRTHNGLLRNLVLRRSEAQDRWLALFVTKSMDVRPHIEPLAAALRAAAPGFAGLVWGVNDGVADVVHIDREAGRVGDPVLEERLDDFRFRVSPLSFFQTNSQGAAVLYRLIREFAGLTGRETLLDAYCGTGSIGIFCARQARRVLGVEIAREAVWDARANAQLNGLDNCTFLAAPMPRGLPLAQQAAGGRFDRVIIDPPRGGMDKRSLRHLIALQAPIFVYVSCNPATLSRDAQTLVESGYKITRVKPVDLFPHTYHIETVVRFERAL